MEKVVMTLENGSEITLNKNQIAYFTKHDKTYVIVMSTGDQLVGTISGTL